MLSASSFKAYTFNICFIGQWATDLPWTKALCPATKIHFSATSSKPSRCSNRLSTWTAESKKCQQKSHKFVWAQVKLKISSKHLPLWKSTCVFVSYLCHVSSSKERAQHICSQISSLGICFGLVIGHQNHVVARRQLLFDATQVLHSLGDRRDRSPSQFIGVRCANRWFLMFTQQFKLEHV